LGVEVALLDLRDCLGSASCRPTSIGPEYGVALAMALSLLRRGRAVPLNFRQGDLAYAGDLQVYRGEIVRIAIGVAAVILLGIAGSIVRYSQITAEEHQIDRGFCTATKQIVGREICNPTAALATMRQAPTVSGIVLPQYSAATLFEMLSSVLDSSIDVSFDDLEFRLGARGDEPDRITGKGEAATFEMIEQVVRRLKKHPCIKGAEVSKQRKSRNNRVEFHLSAKVHCPAGVTPSAPVAVAAAPKAGKSK